ncbi:MAG TPA: hypothetical protein VLJ11_06495 [Bryobacteraceae bacterium]|nr:hypothetical protein [Bryobacteraceae bacterium]
MDIVEWRPGAVRLVSIGSYPRTASAPEILAAAVKATNFNQICIRSNQVILRSLFAVILAYSPV